LRALGFRSVPVTVIGDRAVMGFNPNQISEVLQLGLTVAPRDPARTIPLLGRVLEGVQRAIRQMPDEQLDWTAPDRARPMREFAFHIFRMVQTTIQGLNTGLYPPRSDVIGRSYESFQAIADYGGTVIEEYRAWAAQQDMEALRKLPPRGADERSAIERLDLTAGHTIQHLRQLYLVLDNFGIAPKERIQDSEFPSEYVLDILW